MNEISLCSTWPVREWMGRGFWEGSTRMNRLSFDRRSGWPAREVLNRRPSAGNRAALQAPEYASDQIGVRDERGILSVKRFKVGRRTFVLVTIYMAHQSEETPMKLSASHMNILDHTLHRTANGLYCGSSPEMQELVAAGFMVSAGKASWCPDEYFRITGKGRDAFRQEANEIRHSIGMTDGF